ncbi:hypothetical protein BRD13_05890 [Halobacteriales archaeon SW_5_70_135]|nr:MAG: hypothetical protein BRD13_05890 [Halobacteriales archaeon SW_5_70_135]
MAFSAVDFLGARLNGSYTVVLDESDPATTTLREAPEALETTERDGVTCVVVEEDGTVRQVPIDQYEPLQRATASEGTVDYLGDRTELSVDETGVTLSCVALRTETVDLGHTRNVTLNGQRFFVYLEGTSVLLTTDAADNRQRVARADRYHERENGLWGVAVLGDFVAVTLTTLASLPRRDVRAAASRRSPAVDRRDGVECTRSRGLSWSTAT